MEKKTLFEIKALYRDDLRVTGFEFGQGEKAACIMGAMRGNEIQQVYTCSQLVKRLKEIEGQGKIKEGKKILVIPCANSYSMNIKKRFWSTDNSDINRMYPGYNLGETTQRIAAGIFEAIKDYKIGMQFASFYMPGAFIPHIRMMKTGLENIAMAKEFGLPYVVLRKIRPYDTTTLNYNWQIWETDAFSIYTTTTEKIDEESCQQAVEAVLSFLDKRGIIEYKSEKTTEKSVSRVVEDTELISVRTESAGIFKRLVKVGAEVEKGEALAEIFDTYTGEIKERITAPNSGIIFFAHDEPLCYSSTAVFKIAGGDCR